MSKPTPGPARHHSAVGDTIGAAFESICKTAVWVGIAAMAIGLGFLIYTFAVVGQGGAEISTAQAASNIELFKKVLLGGSIAVTVAMTFLYWGEETLGVLTLVGAALLYFAPVLLPQVFGISSPSEQGAAALAAIQTSGLVSGGIGVVVLVVDIAQRIRVRSVQGSRADALKYGKGIKEERDIQNVFMGKCWQLPFCRKFVRERCPIYHSRRTCWKEQVGCMCEEQVIRDAMEGKVIPKDALTATKYIPYNNKLTAGQKFERCRQCVIYNEHQKHKYKLMLPVTMAVFGGVYYLFRDPLIEMMKGFVGVIDRLIGQATYNQAGDAGKTIEHSGLPFHEILLVCFIVILFAYALRVMEYLVFKLKV